MAFWMPVFGQQDMVEEFLVAFEFVDEFEDLPALRYLKGAPFAEIVLDVDDDECL